MAVFDVDDYLASLKTKYNIPDEELRATEVRGGFLRQDKFSREMQQYNERKTELDTKFAALEPFEKFLRTLETEYQWGPREQWTTDQVSFARQNQNDMSRQPAGLDQAAVQQLVQQSVTTALEEQTRRFNQQIENTQRGAALLIDFIPEARDEWRETYAGKYGFDAKFPKDKFEQFISPGDPSNGVQPGAGYGVPLQAAWNMFKQPFEMKRQEATWEEKVKLAGEDGYRRGASTGGGSLEPFDNDTRSVAMIADRQAALPKEQQVQVSRADSVSRFSAAWDNALRTGSSSTAQSSTPAAPSVPAAPSAAAAAK